MIALCRMRPLVSRDLRRSLWVVGIGAILWGCTETTSFGRSDAAEKSADAEKEVVAETTTQLVETDVEAPDVFQAVGSGLWEGQPSLGGVWVAHPEARDPERVIIRNRETGSFVIGALFRQDAAVEDALMDVSSDAARALRMTAGEPALLDVTALRRAPALEETADPAPSEAIATPPPSSAIQATAQDGPAAAASTASGLTTPRAAPAALDRPFVQIGIFSVQSNATNAAARMRQLGLTPRVVPGTSSSKPYWRVIVGPAETVSDRTEMLTLIQAEGFDDAYAVAN